MISKLFQQITLCLAFSLLLLSGCSAPRQEVYVPKKICEPVVQRNCPPDIYRSIADPGKRHVAALLTLFYHDWEGTPYRRGGMTHRGIDCSGFIQLTYRDIFGLYLPRTAKEQADWGEKVKPSKLAAGDLVFFKTGFLQKHVGIYLDDTRFVHVSYSKGVTISSLEDGYWRDRFWQARRLDATF